MSLLKQVEEKFGTLPKKPVFSLVGAGGKTTCVLKLAEELAKCGKSVLVTTSTHIQHPFYLGMTGLLDADTQTIKCAAIPGKVTIAGRKLECEEKIEGISEEQFEEVLKSYDAAVIEADGAKHKPFKVPAKHEPVIYQATTHILIVESVQAFYHPLEEVCFRLAEAKGILSRVGYTKEYLTPEVAIKLIEDGYIKKLSKLEKKLGVIFNQCELQKFGENLSVPVIYQKKIEMPEKQRICLIMLASGFSKRFGGNKLFYPIKEKPMYRILMEKLKWILQKSEKVEEVCVVSQYQEILEEAKKYGFWAIENTDSNQGISASIKKGIQKVQREDGECYCFFVADQPYLKKETILRLIEGFQRSEKGIGAIFWKGEIGNPVIFHEKYKDELLSLDGDVGGKRILKKHIEDVYLCEAEEARELEDYDYKPKKEAEK